MMVNHGLVSKGFHPFSCCATLPVRIASFDLGVAVRLFALDCRSFLSILFSFHSCCKSVSLAILIACPFVLRFLARLSWLKSFACRYLPLRYIEAASFPFSFYSDNMRASIIISIVCLTGLGLAAEKCKHAATTLLTSGLAVYAPATSTPPTIGQSYEIKWQVCKNIGPKWVLSSLT